VWFACFGRIDLRAQADYAFYWGKPGFTVAARQASSPP
jgi:hypothetical protein